MPTSFLDLSAAADLVADGDRLGVGGALFSRLPPALVGEVPVKPGLGVYKQMLTPENFRFARQAGAEAIVAHYTEVFIDEGDVDMIEALRRYVRCAANLDLPR